MSKQRRSDYDVTDTIQVNDPESVKREVLAVFQEAYPYAPTQTIELSFDLFKRLYQGDFPGYLPCDTIYHDTQHTLDMTLTIARMVSGYDKSFLNGARLGHEKATLAIVTGLFHDAGYVRKADDESHENGAEYTKTHVSRSAEFMENHLHDILDGNTLRIACQIVHLTGYEKDPDQVKVDDPKDRIVGGIVATADLITQMSDRCYIEKCRDRLYPEFVLGGLAHRQLDDGSELVIFESAMDLLYKTPSFYHVDVCKRLDYYFKSLYEYAGVYFGGTNHYMQQLESNIQYLEKLIRENDLEQLRRQPPENHGIEVFPFKRVITTENEQKGKSILLNSSLSLKK